MQGPAVKFVILILLVGGFTFLQAFGFSVFGVKPDLALVTVIAASFFMTDFWQGLLIIVLSAFILKFSPGFNKELLVFSSIGVGALLMSKRLPLHYFLTDLFLIIFGTAIFYLFLNFNLILSLVFLKELLLNLISGILIFALMSSLWQNKGI